jgi:hypothetical protein
MSEPTEEQPESQKAASTEDEAAFVMYINGERVAALHNPKPQPLPKARPHHTLDANRLAGPKLKVERAKCHILDLENTLQVFREGNPYELVHNVDPQTGENVYRILIKQSLPSKLSAILGDIVHNLRAALDHLISDLIRANGREPDGGSGFPITQRAKNLKPGRITKISGVSAKTERFILRLKPYETGSPALWKLHMLDVLDKHAGIIPVAAASVQVIAFVAMPMLFQGPGGEVYLGQGPPGSMPMGGTGVPEKFKPVFPLEDNMEVHRSAGGLQENVQASIGISFGKGQICEGEPVIETLKQYSDLVDRILSICERSCL